ncbi:MAG: GldG family protein [Parcubacteria group bacterium]|nr:GldG family protein [Parcubacteria group bacterium]
MSFFSSKKQVNRASAILAMAVVAALVLVVNLVSLKLFARWDATENRDYSISDTTREIVRNLDDVVNVKAYFTSELPGYLLVRNQDVRGMLSEFESASKGNVKVTYLDPNASDELEREARGIGIPTLQFNVLQEDTFEVRNGYLGLAVFYRDNQEIIPIVQDASTLEYDLSAAITRARRKEIPTVGFVADKGSQPGLQLVRVREMLKQQYEVSDVILGSVELIPEGVDTLIVPGPSVLKARDQYVLDQFLMRGGDLLILAEGTNVDFNNLSVEKRSSGLGELLAHYGVRLNQNLVLDASYEIAPFRTDQTQFYAPYPFWVKIQKGGFNPDSSVVNKLESLVVTWASTLDVLEEKLSDRTQAVELVRTTVQSWTQEEDWQLNPRLIVPPESAEDRKSYVLGVMLSGRFASMFSKDDIPNRTIVDGDTEREEPPSDSEQEQFRSETDEGRLVVIGDADFPLDVNVNRWEANAVFFVNLVDALSSDESLIAIRSKGVTDRPLAKLSEQARSRIKWLNVLGMSALFACYGALRSVRRRRMKAVE